MEKAVSFYISDCFGTIKHLLKENIIKYNISENKILIYRDKFKMLISIACSNELFFI